MPVKAEPVVPPKKDDTNGKGDSVNDKKDKPYRPINQLDGVVPVQA